MQPVICANQCTLEHCDMRILLSTSTRLEEFRRGIYARPPFSLHMRSKTHFCNVVESRSLGFQLIIYHSDRNLPEGCKY